MRVLVTGGAGFIGSNFVRYMLSKYDYKIVVLDKLTYAGRLENLGDIMRNIEFIRGDICNKEDLERVGECDAIINFAAETHVDRSILDAGIFVKTDIFGTFNLLEFCRRLDIPLVQVSTDEVYGSIAEGSFKEEDALNPSSPYSSSKAGADLLARAYYKTYGLPVMITRSSNNFGPYQYPEKLIPLFIVNALQNKPLPLYGDGGNVRDWIYVLDNCEAIDLVFHKGKKGEIYNIGGGNERTNLEISHMILDELKKPKSLIKFVKDRPGHDWRYSLDCKKIKLLGWKPKCKFEEALKNTIKWYKENQWWWEPLITQLDSL
ncbi:MAG: dTDP-glucose 4,6-dehydratase [Candidatus Freyarchaeota archaeon]|nr:dTDP-glucose 4,6-dehydratase [Candidatus Jordarchaeia archaeon]MBS7270575.1 dTDP-glucose 4,6-dehydratase [Candidatus Jordarchaeia archaeon]MBS7281334.1 dTDP-glucose 4,6-dehydratase [Candidatus Jordarchaeia archaeon]